jgi:hypothetical protein
MRAIPPMIAGCVALAAVSVQAAPSPNQEKWRPPWKAPVLLGSGSVVADDEPVCPSGGYAMEHDLLLTRKDGSVRCFHIYDRPRPKD